MNTDVLSNTFEQDNQDYAPTQDYCSWSPDTLAGVSFKRACYIHDRRYGSGADKKVADRELRENIYKLGKAAGKQVLFYLLSRLYYRGVSTLLSRLFYWRATHER